MKRKDKPTKATEKFTYKDWVERASKHLPRITSKTRKRKLTKWYIHKIATTGIEKPESKLTEKQQAVIEKRISVSQMFSRMIPRTMRRKDNTVERAKPATEAAEGGQTNN